MYIYSHLVAQSVMSNCFVIPWTMACQDSLSMGLPRQEDWNGLVFPSPGVLPHPGIEPVSPALQADSLPLSHLGSPYIYIYVCVCVCVCVCIHIYICTTCFFICSSINRALGCFHILAF